MRRRQGARGSRHFSGRRPTPTATALAVLAAVSWPLAAAGAEDALVLGDSIGVGLAATIGLKSIAQRSFSIRRGDVVGQLADLPRDAVGILSLGLNDALDAVDHLKDSIERVVQTAHRFDRRIVWIGPPCVLKPWDDKALALDAYLRQRLSGTEIQYVSLRDARICSRELRAGDGEHFTVSGYRYVWDKIRRDATMAAALEPDPCERDRAEAESKGRKPGLTCAAAGR